MGPDGRPEAIQKSLFPFAADMDPESFENWRLFIGEKDKYPMPIPPPGSIMLNYFTRAAYGLRHKDREKIMAMASNIAQKNPGVRDWIMDGPGRSQMELARILNQLGNKGRLVSTPVAEVGGIEGDLTAHPAYMIGNLPPHIQGIVMGITRTIAVADNWFESSPKRVDFWQRRIMSLKQVTSIIHND